MAPDGQVTDFSAAEWNSTTGKWCDVARPGRQRVPYAGAGSTSTAAVDATARNLKLNFTVSAGQYAGGGLSFDSCVNATAFNAVQFTAAITTGSLTGCTWQVQVQTQDQRASTATNPSGGTCASNCYQFPAYAIAAAPTATPTTTTALFIVVQQSGGLDDPDADADRWVAVAGQLVGRDGHLHRRAAHRRHQVRHAVIPRWTVSWVLAVRTGVSPRLRGSSRPA